ncbi:MAG: hypothetical protein ACE15C_04860 [Phycisphaerae bacterium]
MRSHEDDSLWTSRSAFLRIDYTAGLFFLVLTPAMRPIAGLYAQANLPPPPVIAWLSALPWWVVAAISVAAVLVVVGKNFFIRSRTAKLVTAVLTLAALGVGVALVALAVFKPILHMMEQAGRP